MLLKKIGANLAFAAIAGYMIVLRLGKPSVWIVVGIVALWAAGLFAGIWRNRAAAKEVLKGLPGSLFVSARPVTGAGVPRPVSGRIARVLSVLLSTGMALLSAAGIYRYLAWGERGDDGIDTALTVLLLLFLCLFLFRRRKKYLCKVRRAAHR